MRVRPREESAPSARLAEDAARFAVSPRSKSTFCSKHCADIDLGRWLDGRYAVPGEPIGAEKDDEDDKKD